ncbi:MAG: hypothetical protein ACKVP0_16740 [Pirellulaceae bacterium]
MAPKARWITLGILVLVHLCLASAIAFIPFKGTNYPNRPLIGLVLGITFGQISLTGAWCAFGPGRFFLRVPLALMAASFSGLALAAFMLRTSPNNNNDFWFSVALVLVGWLLLQPPLWMISSHWKCSLRLPKSSQDKPSEAMQFTLAHMLLWTLGVALLLGIGRMALRDVQLSPDRGWGRDDVMIFLIFLVVNFLLAIPVTLVMLALKQLTFRFLAVLSWSLVLGVLECVCLAFMTGPVVEPSSLLLIILLNFIHGLVLAGSLFVLTAVGYRWQRDAVPPDRAVQWKDASR